MPQFIDCAMMLAHTGLAQVLADCTGAGGPLRGKYRVLLPTVGVLVARWCLRLSPVLVLMEGKPLGDRFP